MCTVYLSENHNCQVGYRFFSDLSIKPIKTNMYDSPGFYRFGKWLRLSRLSKSALTEVLFFLIWHVRFSKPILTVILFLPIWKLSLSKPTLTVTLFLSIWQLRSVAIKVFTYIIKNLPNLNSLNYWTCQIKSFLLRGYTRKIWFGICVKKEMHSRMNGSQGREDSQSQQRKTSSSFWTMTKR